MMPMQERRMQIASGHFREEAFKRNDKNKEDQKDQEAQSESDSDNSSVDQDAKRERRLQRQQKAKELEFELLKKSCTRLMKSVRDQSEELKLVQFRKFFPEVWSKITEDLKGVGTKVGRQPPQDSHEKHEKIHALDRAATIEV